MRGTVPGNRVEDLREIYAILDRLDRQVGGTRKLSDCNGRMFWPTRGVYFFFEGGEIRAESSAGNRIVRVGTHALKPGSKTTLWNRLSQHRGVHRSGGGNHRGSIFRQHVGTALLRRDPDLHCPTWADGSSAPPDVRSKEQPLELMVSDVIGDMPVLWLGIDDAAGPDGERGYIERNAIALLSNFGRTYLDGPMPGWLGRHCTSARIRQSGLWNSNHVDEEYDPAFLGRLEHLVARNRIL